MSNLAKLPGKVLYFALVLWVFFKMFFFSTSVPWVAKYELFSVPAYALPGVDARTIQMAAHCFRQGISYFNSDECVTSAALVRRLYPDAVLTKLDYPSLWVDAYSLFRDDSERFFMRFWRLNALFVVAGIAVYCFKYNYSLLPLLLFCPPVLMVIERGNIDATTFFVTYLPLLIFTRSRFLQSFFLGLSSALKIFPLFGYLAFLRLRRPFIPSGVILGALLAVPFMLITCREVLFITSRIAKAFPASYGLSSVTMVPYLRNHLPLAYLSMLAFVIIWCAFLYFAFRSKKLKESTDRDLATLNENDLLVLVVSASIFVFSFLITTNWCYRLIFVFPSFLILSKGKSLLAKLICVNILFVLWVPYIPYGYDLLNLGCFPLAVTQSYMLIKSVRCSTSREVSLDASLIGVAQ